LQSKVFELESSELLFLRFRDLRKFNFFRFLDFLIFDPVNAAPAWPACGWGRLKSLPSRSVSLRFMVRQFARKAARGLGAGHLDRGASLQ